MSLLRDLLAGPGNAHWDLGRIGAAWGFVLVTGAWVFKAVAGQEIDLVELGTGYGAVAAAAGALIALKDRARPASGE